VGIRRVGTRSRWKVGFEDRLHTSIAGVMQTDNAGSNASGLSLAVGLRDEHSSDGVRPVSLVPERQAPSFAKPPLHPYASMSGEVLTVYTGCAIVGAALGVGVRQDVLAG